MTYARGGYFPYLLPLWRTNLVATRYSISRDDGFKGPIATQSGVQPPLAEASIYRRSSGAVRLRRERDVGEGRLPRHKPMNPLG